MPKAPANRKTMSPSGIFGMLGTGIPVVTSPTTATPRAGRSSSVESPIPTTSATRAPGIRGAIRLRMRMPRTVPTPRAVV